MTVDLTSTCEDDGVAMHGGTRQISAVGFVLAALLAGAVGCSSGSGDAAKKSDSATAGAKGAPAAAADTACANGTYTWFNIEKPTRLLGVTDVETLGKGGGELKKKLKRLATVEISVQAGSGAPAADEVLFSLGKKIGEIDSDAASLKDAGGESWRFTEVGGKGPELNDGSAAPYGSGRFVMYAAVRVVEADFRHSCPGGRTSTGHAESWTTSIDGLLECGTKDGSATVREAARLSCGADSAAAKAA
ncbi:hypothetical protein [Streptomyces sp. SID12501]|uniref:Uncharacterized protein n=1 Tax=Streptomyces sp. SID12501 TaxID=2706042 RepID=A0A6B3BT68_9ACTN|nr:hypothetical protein [Streptomyces sp. SID12501]NEC87544.1 hypothetical protein [Streptomyces sp. SID12501]